MQRNVVYTCLFGHSEQFSDHDYEDDSVDYICFTDDPSLVSAKWQFRVVENKFLDSHRFSKSFKHLPHRYLPEYARSLYIDNTVMLKRPPSEIFADLRAVTLAMLKHPDRDCIYDEARAVLHAQYDDPAIVRDQMRFYRSLGYPANNGLDATTFLLRDHNSTALISVNEDWHRQVLRYSKRDQLSWNVCAWLHGFRYTRIDERLQDNTFFSWPVVKGNVRLPRNFDDEMYLSLNPDVKQAGLDPRSHYLAEGHRKGRPYMRLRERIKGCVVARAARARSRMIRSISPKR
jgi:hypothetical protein